LRHPQTHEVVLQPVRNLLHFWSERNGLRSGAEKRGSGYRVKTQQVVKSRGQYCGDLELAAYLANAAGPVPLVLDLRIVHDRIGSSANPALNGTLTYPNNIDESLNKAANDKIRKYRADYNNNPPNAVAFMPAIAGTTGRLHSEFIRLLFLQAHRETDRFFCSFKSSVSAIKLGVSVLPLSPRGFFFYVQITMWKHSRKSLSSTYYA